MPSCHPSPGSGGAMCSSSDSNSLAGRCGATLCALDTLPPRPLSFCLLVESLAGTKACFGVPSTGGFLAEFCVELLFLRSPRTFRGVFCGSGAPTCLPGFSAEGRRVTAENHHSTLPQFPQDRCSGQGRKGLGRVRLQHIQKQGSTACCPRSMSSYS